MEAMIIFACVMIILVCAAWLVKQVVLGVTWLIKNTVDDIFKDLDMNKKE